MTKFSLALLVIGYGLCIMISLIYYGQITLLSLINTSFFIGGGYLFFSLTVFVLSTGFFDLVTNSFRKTLSMTKPMIKEEIEDMRSMSEAISIVEIKPFLYSGSIITGTMFIALFFYYS